MKNFTYPQKKWVMTAALLGALGLNISFNSHGRDGLATADFASTVAEGVVQGKIYTSKGVVPVKYIDHGENKVLAIVPKQMTEGKVCDTCGYDSIPLSVKNKTDIDVLNVELLKAMGDKFSKTVEAAPKAGETKPVVEAEETEKPGPFESIESSCEKKRSNVALCFKDKFIKILKDKKLAKDIDSKDAMDFYKEEIQSRLLSQMAEARRNSAKARRDLLREQDPSFTLPTSTDFLEDEKENIKNVADIIGDLISEVPSKFESIRRAALVAQAEIIKYEAAQYKEVNTRALTTKNYAELPSLINERNATAYELNYVHNILNTNTQMAIEDAYYNDNMSLELRNQYARFLTDFNSSLIDALTGKGTALNGISGTPTLDLSSRLASPSRIGTVGTPIVSNRTGNNLSATPTINPLSNTAAMQSANSRVIIPTENNGVSFGPMGPISADALKMRVEIQNRFPRQ